MRKQRKNYTSQEKVFIIKRHLVDQVPVSDLCDEYNLQPNVFYRWQKEFFENGSAAFEKKNVKKTSAEQQRIEQLEAKLRNKNDVLSELMEEHVKLKKDLGDL
ncbi:transposase [Prosthecochloris sp. N3]|uniref:Transposase n=2 Tax=Prosthecochloris TaxID=1101 RepID=A0ABR9XRS8_9CHLB|nr:transposase [Prosthecochloris ethylica]MBF0636629.1 transposase [Prosthecochloris ethylica]MBF0637741.1 transposase [Prosthecochloris ethylica]